MPDLQSKTQGNLLKLVGFDDPVLRAPTAPIQFPLSIEDKTLIRDMLYSIQEDQLKAADAPWHAAAGMAANQWGFSKRIFLFCPDRDSEDILVAINPSYLPINHPKGNEPELDAAWEGCFSVPKATGLVERYTHIKVTYQNLSGETITQELTGWSARVWQHENDHLDGYLYNQPKNGRCTELKDFPTRDDAIQFRKKAEMEKHLEKHMEKHSDRQDSTKSGST